MQRVNVDLLLLVNDAVRAQLPPLVGREVRGNLRLWPAASKPLNQVQVVRLSQPVGKFEQVGILGQFRHTMNMIHQLEDGLLGAIAQEKLHAAGSRPGRWEYRQRKMIKTARRTAALD